MSQQDNATEVAIEKKPVFDYSDQSAVNDLIERALNAACFEIQEAIGQNDGGVAGIFFTGQNRDIFQSLFADYIRTEKLYSPEN